MRQKRIAVIIVTVVLILGLLYNMTSNVNSESNNYGLSNPIVSEENTIWDCIYFGNYLQEDTNNDGIVNEKDEKQPIKWRVLSIDNHSAMLFSDKLLDFKQYEESDNCYGTNASGNEMKEVLRKEVNQAWDVLRLVTSLYGDTDKRTADWRGQWYALDSLWNKFYPNEDY